MASRIGTFGTLELSSHCLPFREKDRAGLQLTSVVSENRRDDGFVVFNKNEARWLRDQLDEWLKDKDARAELFVARASIDDKARVEVDVDNRSDIDVHATVAVVRLGLETVRLVASFSWVHSGPYRLDENGDLRLGGAGEEVKRG